LSQLNIDTSLGMIHRVQSGDDVAWQEFAIRCASILEQWARWRGLQSADAEDIAQDGLLIVLARIRDFRHEGRGSLRAWLRAIAWRCVSQARPRAGTGSAADAHELQERYRRAEDHIAELEEHFDRLQQLDLLHQSMNAVRERVRPQTWEAFRLLMLEQLSGPDVAALLQMQPDAVYAAKARVQRLISAEIRRRQNNNPPASWRHTDGLSLHDVD
jgi:RNA polymerase sigma-70 factor (ECF subfamily)